MFSITAFYHRYFSHRTFKTSRFFQFIGAFIACSSGQRGPLWWAAHHRRHHRHSDTEKDVHSPQTRSFFWSHTLWFMTEYSVPTFLKEIPDLVKFKELRFLNRYDWIPLVMLSVLCYFAPEIPLYFELTGLSNMQSLIWGFFVPTIFYTMPLLQLIRSLIYLVTPIKTGDESRNNWIVAIFAFGEGWHNNHHFFPGSARQGFFKGEFDITYYGLKFLSFIGLVRDLRPVPAWLRKSNQELTRLSCRENRSGGIRHIRTFMCLLVEKKL